MSKEKLKKLIDGILAERRDRVYEKMDHVTNNIIIQLEELKDLGDFQHYKIPEDFELYEKPKEGTTIDILHRYIRKLSLSANQLDLINNFLEGVNQFCTRAALFLLREDKLVGWKGKGFPAVEGAIGDEEIKKIFFSLSANTIFKHVLEKQSSYSGPPQSRADDHLIYSRFGGQIPEKILTLPFFVKGKPQAVIYTDTFAGKPIGKKEIEMIATVGEMSLDLLPLRQKILAKIKTREYPEDVEEDKAPPEKDTADDLTVHSVKEDDPDRLARVIVNDIYLYNKGKVDEALNTGENLYDLLQNTILQSRELYLNKYNDLSPFERQLVETLAKGKKELLKGYHFEAI